MSVVLDVSVIGFVVSVVLVVGTVVVGLVLVVGSEDVVRSGSVVGSVVPTGPVVGSAVGGVDVPGFVVPVASVAVGSTADRRSSPPRGMPHPANCRTGVMRALLHARRQRRGDVEAQVVDLGGGGISATRPSLRPQRDTWDT